MTMKFYDPSSYPEGVPNPQHPRVHAWRGGPLNQGSRFHGPNYYRPMSRPRYFPQRLSGIGALDVDTLGGSFATRGYGGGIFNQRLAGVGLYGDGLKNALNTMPVATSTTTVPQTEWERLRCHQTAEAAFQQRLDASIDACRQHMDWMRDEGIGTEADAMVEFNTCVGRQNAEETARLSREKAKCGDDVVINPAPTPVAPPAAPLPAPAARPVPVHRTVVEGPDWTTWLFWGGVGAAVTATGYLIATSKKGR